MAASKVRDQYYFYALNTIRETARRLEMATQKITDCTMVWSCHRCGNTMTASLITGGNQYECAKCGTWYDFVIKQENELYIQEAIKEALDKGKKGIYEGRNERDDSQDVATRATDWLDKWLDMFPDKKQDRISKVADILEENNEVLASASFEDNQDGVCNCSYCKAAREYTAKKHAKELQGAVDLLVSLDTTTEPTEFKGFTLKYEPVEPTLDNEAINKWLRYCEKEIAKELSLSDAWIHISINGDFLCSL